jgi:hypothetical protein
MKATILFLIGCSMVVSADINSFADKTDPASAGMNPAMLARIPTRMREFVMPARQPVLSRSLRGTDMSAASMPWVIRTWNTRPR